MRAGTVLPLPKSPADRQFLLTKKTLPTVSSTACKGTSQNHKNVLREEKTRPSADETVTDVPTYVLVCILQFSCIFIGAPVLLLDLRASRRRRSSVFVTSGDYYDVLRHARWSSRSTNVQKLKSITHILSYTAFYLYKTKICTCTYE